MPEGHTVHRLARALEILGGEPLHVTSPQGRFAAGASRIDGHVLVASEAWGKQLFLGFAEPGAGRTPGRWVRVHLGLYGAWTFAGDSGAVVVQAIGAPRRSVREREIVVPGHVGAADGPWSPPAPRGAVRMRLLGARAVADLTGPAVCELITAADKRAVEDRLGPDPLRDDALPDGYVAAVRRSRVAVGQLLMRQDVIAGIGNIYRAESLFRAGLDPLAPGNTVPAEVLRALWDDVAALMADGVAHGRIVTTRPEDRSRPGADPEVDDAFYVYRRGGLPCRVCASPVLVKELGGRNLFWCGVCQS